MSCITGHVSCVTCRVSPVTCHLSQTLTATATDPPPANSKNNSRLVCKDSKTPQKKLKRKKSMKRQKPENVQRYANISNPVHREAGFPPWHKHTHTQHSDIATQRLNRIPISSRPRLASLESADLRLAPIIVRPELTTDRFSPTLPSTFPGRGRDKHKSFFGNAGLVYQRLNRGEGRSALLK